jgi:hypothetical protein
MDRARLDRERHIAVGVHVTKPLVDPPQLDSLDRQALDRSPPSYFAM